MRARTSHGPQTLEIRAWATAVLAACAGHVVILALALLAGRLRGPAIPWGRPKLPPHVGLALEDEVSEEALIDLAALDLVRPAEPAPVLEPAHDDLADGLPADQTRLLPVAATPRAGALDRRRPATDGGTGRGRPLDDVAWRPDASTLHQRLTDGAERYQPAHTRTAAGASSPQAVRRQPMVGIADAPRSTRVAFAPQPAAFDIADPDDVGHGGQSVAGAPTTAAAQAASGQEGPPTAVAGAGPLDAQRGTVSFDVALRGVAQDDRGLRAASAEARPSIMDLSRAASVGDTRAGQGPADAPGATPRPSPGSAPALTGQAGGTVGVDEATRTRERAYARYEQELRARVNQYLGQVWPRALAVRLEQGEAMVSLVVQPDGRLAEPARVMKSAGFVEFDRAALEAIRLAAPFPPLPRPGGLAPSARPFSLRVIFSNPVIR